MNDLTFTQMQAIQHELQEKYKDKWKPICPENGRNQLLWMMIEAGEMADIMKKQGDAAIMNAPEVRTHFVEEICDVLMYLNDVMLCYGVTPQELTETYVAKHKRNMSRW